MTHDILQSDIDLAVRLRSDQHPDEEIITALAQRGVDRAKAAQLVDDLRNGRPITIQPSAPPEFTAVRRSRSKTRAREGESAQRALSGEPERAPQPDASGRSRKKTSLARVVILVLAVLAIAAAAVFLIQRQHATKSSADDPQGSSAGKQSPSLVRAKPAAGAAASLVLELQPDGLRIGGSRVTADNVLAVAASLLGFPSRTNQLAKTGATVYAYDPHGLLIYSQKAGGTNSIVLDCEATGGPNGTTSPFAGVLKVEDQVIGLDTDPEALAGIEKLGLAKPRSGATIWSGRYHNLSLVFAYARLPGHLSLIEIDLK